MPLGDQALDTDASVERLASILKRMDKYHFGCPFRLQSLRSANVKETHDQRAQIYFGALSYV